MSGFEDNPQPVDPVSREKKRCFRCRGRGKILSTEHQLYFQQTVYHNCSDCNGTGYKS